MSVHTFPTPSAALSAEKHGQQEPVAQVLESLPSAVAAALNAQRTERRALVDQRGLGKPPFVLRQRRGDFQVWAKEVENFAAGVCVARKRWLGGDCRQSPRVGRTHISRDRLAAIPGVVCPHGR